MDTPDADEALITEADGLRGRLSGLQTRLRGDRTRSRRNQSTPPSINERVQNVVYSQWSATSAPTKTEQDAYRHAGTEFAEALGELRALADDLEKLEAKLEAAGAPWTPGRIPLWEME